MKMDIHTYYRPIWTCGRYNKEKHVAIMYNLIAGISFFFESYSADVIGEILKVQRCGCVSINSIANELNIAEESVEQFFDLLCNNGLLSQAVITDDVVANYRKQILDNRKHQTAYSDLSTEEKLPMAYSNAEMRYSEAVDDGKTITSIMFELTYRCSEMCIHCYNPGATRNDSEISHRGDLDELNLEDYKRVIDELCELGLVKVCLSGGDPFSKSIVWDIIDYLYKKEIAFDIFTNGLNLKNSVQRLVNYFPRLVGVSIYSGKAEDHDAITRIPGSWKCSIQVVEELSNFAIPLNLKCCIMQPNLHTYYMVADLAKQYSAVPQFEINITDSNDGDMCARWLRLTEEQLNVVLRDNNLKLYVGPEAPGYGGQKRNLRFAACGAGGTGFCLSPDGGLRACTAFTQIYGNVRRSSLVSILENSKELKDWRSSSVEQYTECGRYDYCDYCNLCSGVNYTEHKDFRKPAESNCYMAKIRYNLAHRLMDSYTLLSREEFVNQLQLLPINKVELHRIYNTKG